MPIADASNFVFFQLINDYLRDEINTFQWNLLTSTAQFVGAIGLMLLTAWIVYQGFCVVTGRTQQPMMALVRDALRATLIVSIAMGAASASSSLYWTLTDGTTSAITSLVSQDSESPYRSIDRNLAYMQGMFSVIDTLASSGDPSVDGAKARAKWFSGIGIAGPGVIGGAILLINKIAIALFVGFGPLFITCLLFGRTKSLFSKWLFYGIGTVFSLAVLTFMVGLANNVIRSVSVAFLAKYAALLAGGGGGFDGEGITSLAMQQGGLGLVLTVLIVSAPAMAAAFFRGVLGQFQAYSSFGMLGRGGGTSARRNSASEPAPTAADYGEAERTNPPGDLRAIEVTFSRDMALRQAGGNPAAPQTTFTGHANSSTSIANDTRVVRDFDPDNKWDPDALVNVGADGSPIAQATYKTGWPTVDHHLREQPAGELAGLDWSRQAQVLMKQSDQLSNAAEYVRNNGMPAAADEYQQVANRAYYDGLTALLQANRINSESSASIVASQPGSPFASGWSYMGANSSGLPYGHPNPRMADYATAGLGSLSGNAGAAVNLYNGNGYAAGGVTIANPSSIAFRPGGQITLGWILGANDAQSTDAFLSGGANQAFVSVPTPWKFNTFAAVTHSYGGRTAIELGLALPGSLNYGVVPIAHAVPAITSQK